MQPPYPRLKKTGGKTSLPWEVLLFLDSQKHPEKFQFLLNKLQSPTPLPGTTFIQAQNVGSVSSSSKNFQEIRL